MHLKNNSGDWPDFVYKTSTLVLVLRSFLKSLWSLTFSMSGDTFAACSADDTATCGGERQRSSFLTVKAKHHERFKTISPTACQYNWHLCKIKCQTMMTWKKRQQPVQTTYHNSSYITPIYPYITPYKLFSWQTTGKEFSEFRVSHKTGNALQIFWKMTLKNRYIK